MNKNNKGFSVVEIIIVLAVIAIIGLVGWNIFSRQATDSPTDTNASDSTSVEMTLPAVNSKDDLQAAEDAVNAIDIDESIDMGDIDASLE